MKLKYQKNLFESYSYIKKILPLKKSYLTSYMKVECKIKSIMPQVDNTVFFSVIFSLIHVSIICYAILFLYVFYPFVSTIKAKYNFFSKTKQIKDILIAFF